MHDKKQRTLHVPGVQREQDPRMADALAQKAAFHNIPHADMSGEYGKIIASIGGDGPSFKLNLSDWAIANVGMPADRLKQLQKDSVADVPYATVLYTALIVAGAQPVE